MIFHITSYVKLDHHSLKSQEIEGNDAFKENSGEDKDAKKASRSKI